MLGDSAGLSKKGTGDWGSGTGEEEHKDFFVCSEGMPILCAAFSCVSGLKRHGMAQNKCPIGF